MSFGGFVENNSGGGGGGVRNNNIGEISYNNERMPFGSFSQPRLVTTPALAKSMFNSPGLSLALQTNIDGQEDVNRSMHENFEQNGLRRSREEEQSRSGSDNLDGVSGDEQDADDKPPRKKRYHRHTPQQIQELEALFKECPHPDEKQRLELSKRLCLETRQVKFWFQNRRTQMKTQLERHENNLLRQENDKLRAENMSIRDAMRNPICSNCGGPAMIGEISLEEQHLRIENARLKDELDRVCALAGKFLGRPISSLPNSSLELGVGGNNNNGFNVMNNVSSTLPDFSAGMSNNPLAIVSPSTRQTPLVGGFDRSVERSMFLELALTAMDELVKMAQTSEPLWIRSIEGGREILNHEEYMRTFTPCIGLKPNGFVSEASRETGTVIINSLALVETLMDSNRWIEMFPCIIARGSTNEVIANGIHGTRNGALQLMQAELHVLSPLVPVREVNFLRFCKQHAEGVWAVVDVSIDSIRETSGATSFMNCRKLPSGCVVQDMPNGYSKVTWVEHAEYEENQVHQLYRPLLSSGMGFGAARWVATLQRSRELLKSGAVVVRRRWMSTVMSFGDGSHGALGLPTTTVGIGVDSYEPTPIPSLPSDILTIHAGHYHSLATTSQGHLWAWGRNNEAQLGRGLSGRETWNEPKRVEGLENVKVCAAFASGVVSSAVGEDGSVWVWGKSKRGQLGLGKDVIEAVVPSRVEALSRENIAKVSFGWGHALALTVDGKLFGWGYYADGRIGNMGNDRLESSPLDSAAIAFSNNTQLTSSDLEVAEKKVLQGMKEESNMPIIWEPRLVEELRNVQVVDIACGLDHSLVLCRDGVLLSSGSNVYGQLGRTRQDLGFFPVDIDFTLVSVAAGVGHSLAICELDESDRSDTVGATNIASWGWNQSSQLGRSGPANLPALIDTLDGENPVSVSAGRAHSIALTSKGDMWVWGSGKNGRLGLSSSVDEVEPFYLDSLEGFQILQAVSGFDHNLVLVAE